MREIQLMSQNLKIRLKVENAERNKKVGVVASSLHEVIQKAKNLGLVEDDGQCRVVLGSDSSMEIADDEYLLALEPDTAVIVLSGLQKSIEDMRIPVDEQDSGSAKEHSWRTVLRRIAHNIGYIGLLTQEELEVVAEEDDLWTLVKGDVDLRHVWAQNELEEIQERCQSLLDSRRRVSDAVQLVQLYQKVNQTCKTADDASVPQSTNPDKFMHPKGI